MQRPGSSSSHPSDSATTAQPRSRARGPARLRRWFRDGLLRRVFKNAGILLSGKALAGLFGLGALAVTARALGPELFGTLVLVQTYVLFVGGLAKFQSWQAVIHYGAQCLDEDRVEDLQGLIKLTMLLDLGSAVLGMGVAAAAASTVGPWLGWGPEVVPLAMLYSVMILFTITATPTGILRLFDRFDLLAAQSAVTPALRLIGACAAYLSGAGLGAFIIVWLVSGVAGRLSLVALGWREFARQGLMHGMNFSLRRLVKPHPRLWRFVWSTNLNMSLYVIADRGRTLAVGWVLGPAAAGLFEVAKVFSGVIIKPVTHLAQSIYPELAKLSAEGGAKPLRRLMVRAGLIAGGGATLILAGLVVLGEPLIRLTVGEAYVGAYGVFMLLALASVIGVYGFALGPVMLALGKPNILFRANLVLVIPTFSLLLLLLWQMGLIGAGIATVAGSVIWLVAVGVITFRRLRKREAGGRMA